MGLTSSGAARADLPRAIDVRGDPDGCPSSGETAKVLSDLWPHVAVTIGPGAQGAISVEVTDDGRTYRVRIAGRERAFADGARRCAERARTAAAFIAVTLAPPTVAGPAAATSAPTSLPAVPTPPLTITVTPTATVTATPTDTATATAPAPAPATPTAAFDTPTVLAADLGALVASAASASTIVGAALGVSLSGPRLGGVLGASFTTPAELTFGGTRVRLGRTVFAAAVRVHRQHGALDLAVDIGLAAAIDEMTALDVPIPVNGSRLDLGASLAARAALRRWSRLAPFVSVEADYFPRPYDLVIEPQGVVGWTPAVWIGATAGVSFMTD